MTNFAQKFTETKIEKGNLSGARIFVAPFPSDGVVSIAGSIAGGTRAADALGLPREVVSVHASMLLEGTRGRSKNEIQSLLDSIGAELSFGTSAERLNFFARVPSKHVTKLLSLVADVLAEARFPAKELEVLKKRALASLSLSEEDPRTQAGIALARALYPKGHLNYSETTDESRKALLKMTSATLREYHKQTTNAATLIVVGAGDIELPTFAKEVNKRFAHIPNSGFILEPIVLESAIAEGKPLRKVRPIAGKSSIDYMIGLRIGMTEDHPDYPALLLGMKVLGNAGFTGRLMQNVREKEGLTYGTYAYVAGLDGGADGYAMAWATFAPELFSRGRTAVIGEIEKILHEGAGEEEVRKHAVLYAAKAEVRMSDSGAYARAAHEIIAEGRKLSYLDEFPESVRRLTAEQVNRALKKYLRLGLMSEAAAGPVAKDALK